MNTEKYLTATRALSDELGHLILWKTKVGNVDVQIHKLLGVSRPSHVAYMDDDSIVPNYIWNQFELLDAMPSYKRVELAYKTFNTKETTNTQSALSLAIKGWEQMTNREFGDFKGSDFAGHFSARRANQKMNEVLKDDPSGVAAALLLSNYIEECAESLEFRFSEFYTNSPKLNRIAAGYMQSKLALTESPLGNAINQFKDMCRNAISFYKPEYTASEQLINGAIGTLIDAKKRFKRFDKYQISKDALAANNEQLKIQEQIFIFESISDLVDHSAMIPNGFSLSLIRTARPTDSFFCLVVKAGGNIYLMSDKPKSSEFERDAMANRNQRYNLQRYEDSMFPYEFIDMDIDNGGRDITIKESSDLVTTQDGLRVLGHFREMRNDSILWFTFLLEECRNEFFADLNPKVPALGYVDLGTIEHKLLSSPTDSKQLPSTYVSKGSIIQKTAKQLTRANFVKNLEKGGNLLSKNAWMEAKYNDQIDDSLLYIPENAPSDALILVNKSNGIISLENKGEVSNNSDLTQLKVTLKRLPATMLGTPQEVQAEADLFARYNKAKIISKLMKDDFKERESEVKTWLAKKIKRNLPTLIDRLVSLDHEYFFIAHRLPEFEVKGEVPMMKADLFRQVHVANMKAKYDWKAPRTELQKVLGIRDVNDNAKCAMSKVMFPDYSFFLQVDSIHDLEILTGLPKDKFPVELQNWRSRSDLVADARSYAYDPVEALQNPWWWMDYRFAVNLDREYVLKRRKELGVKGRFIKPKSYFEPDGADMYKWLRFHPKMGDVKASYRDYSRHSHNKPSWAYYTSG